MIAEIVRSKRTSSPLKCEQFPNHVRNSVYECITNSRKPDTHTPTLITIDNCETQYYEYRIVQI